jgi:hypothetical protein
MYLDTEKIERGSAEGKAILELAADLVKVIPLDPSEVVPAYGQQG